MSLFKPIEANSLFPILFLPLFSITSPVSFLSFEGLVTSGSEPEVGLPVDGMMEESSEVDGC